MSLLNTIETKDEYLFKELKIREIQQKRDHGHVADDLKEIIKQLEAYVNVQAPVETIDTIVVNNVSAASTVDTSIESAASVVPTEVQQVAPVAIPLTCVAPK